MSASGTPPEVLVIADWYLPGTKAGGPVRSLSGLVELLGEEVRFALVTRGHDLGDRAPYPGIRIGAWTRLGTATVWYLGRGVALYRGLLRAVRSVPHDVVYLNSIFSSLTRWYLLFRRLRIVPRRPVILAPRGELGAEALRLKGRKKGLYLAIARLLGVYDDLVWSATSTFERDDILRMLGDGARRTRTPEIVIAPNVMRLSPATVKPRPKTRGHARVVFVSRIDRKKNLDGALRALALVKDHIDFDIYGPGDDARYRTECEAIAQALPSNVTVRFLGQIRMEEVIDTVAQYDLFFLPTRNENFGHVIIEALAAGTPVLISDQTAWRDLERHRAGWDVPFHDLPRFGELLGQVAAMSTEELHPLRVNARRYAQDVVNAQQAVAAHRALFSRFRSSGGASP